MKKVFIIFILFWLSISIYAQDYEQKLRPVKGLNEKWGFLDGTGKEIIPFKYKAVKEFSEGLAAVKLKNKWGFIDKTGQEIIPFMFDDVGKCSDGMVRVYSDGWYFIDKNSLEIVLGRYYYAGDFSDGLARVKVNGNCGFINKSGTAVISFIYDDASDFSEGLARVIINYKWGYINNIGTVIIPLIYDDASDFSEGLARVKIKRNWGFIDKTGKEVIKNIPTETINETKAQPTSEKQASDNTNEPQRVNRDNKTECTVKNAFGLDFGLGGSFYAVINEKSLTLFTSALGMRIMHHFNPYFGIDFLKINWLTDVLTSGSGNPWQMRLQIMPGIRVNTPAFFKCMSVYVAFRLGYGMTFHKSHFEGLCLETEFGLNLSRAVFAGFAYNYHKYFAKDVDKLAMHTLSFRLGFNLGK